MPTKMTIQLDDGRLVDFDFTQPNNPVAVSSSSPLSFQEEATLIFKAGLFIGGGNKALAQFE